MKRIMEGIVLIAALSDMTWLVATNHPVWAVVPLLFGVAFAFGRQPLGEGWIPRK